MANVRDAMKKREAELAQQARQAARVEPETQTEKPAEPADEPKPPEAGKDKPRGVFAKISGNGDYSELLIAHHDHGAPITDEYRALRTSLLANCPDEKFCYLVTSSEAGEGKTVTCLNLAVVMAERVESRTVVVDCDLRRGRMSSLLKASPVPGMVDLLRGEKTLKECVQPTSYSNLFFLPAGKAGSSEVGELAGRPEFEDVITELRRDYDYVILDTPPINRVSDPGVMGRTVGEALLVVRMNHTHKESIDKAIRLLHAANVNLSGVILTHQKYYIPNYLYRYS